jgi:hypothetical protein
VAAAYLDAPAVFFGMAKRLFHVFFRVPGAGHINLPQGIGVADGCQVTTISLVGYEHMQMSTSLDRHVVLKKGIGSTNERFQERQTAKPQPLGDIVADLKETRVRQNAHPISGGPSILRRAWRMRIPRSFISTPYCARPVCHTEILAMRRAFGRAAMAT